MTSYHELAAKLAGDSGKPSPHGGPLTPRALIGTYCQPGMQSGWTTHTREHSTYHAGFCGFDERKGYENGYVWIADLTHSGWEPQHDIGHWPYTACALWPALASDPRDAIAHYCEGDIAVEIFDSSESMASALVKLRLEDPSGRGDRPAASAGAPPDHCARRPLSATRTAPLTTPRGGQSRRHSYGKRNS